MTIVLKDRTDANVAFVKAGSTATSRIFLSSAKDGTLVGRKRLTLSVTETASVFRCKFKLEQPHTCAPNEACRTEVIYTQVASGDVSVVKFSTSNDRADLVAFIKSITGTAEWVEMVQNGNLPNL